MSICDKYIMVGDEVVLVGLEEWGQWYEHSNRSIGKDFREGVRISTVFLGIDHGFPWAYDMYGKDWAPKDEYKPILWETMIFGGPLDEEQWRYNSLEKAKAGHLEAVRLVELTNVWWYRWWHCYIQPFWYEHIQPYVDLI